MRALLALIPSPLGGEGQGEGMSAAITLSCILSPQGRGENNPAPHPLGVFSL